MWGWRPCQAANILSSNHPMNMQAKVGAALVPMATPNNCKNNTPSNTNKLHVNTNIMRDSRNDVGIAWFSLLSMASSKAVIPSVQGTLLYIPDMSSVTGMVPGGWGPHSFCSDIIWRKCLVSSSHESCFLTSSLANSSTKWEIPSVLLPDPETIGLRGGMEVFY